MKLLLDTCALIWLCSNPKKFSEEATNILSKIDAHDLYISDATTLELALKSANRKLSFGKEPSQWLKEQCSTWAITALPIDHKDILLSARLPRHHKDPIDRLIVATAINRNLPIVTADGFFSQYDVKIVW